MKNVKKSSATATTQDQNASIVKQHGGSKPATKSAKKTRQVSHVSSDKGGAKNLNPIPESDDIQYLVFTIVRDKFLVETDFFDSIELQFNEIYPALMEEVDYSPQDLCGDAFWADLSDLGQRLAVHCLQHLATLPDVPLLDMSCPNCGTTCFAVF
jgi:hypothetical protein